MFCGVNGVGKSTNLAKIAYWLTNKKQRVLIAACDTFRSGAVEQLMTHKNSLNKIVGFDNASADPDAAPVALYESGYGKNAADVAKDAIVHARQTGRDVVVRAPLKTHFFVKSISCVCVSLALFSFLLSVEADLMYMHSICALTHTHTRAFFFRL